MSLAGILLGLLNIAIVVVILVLVGAIVVWVFSMLGWAIPWNVQRLYLAVVALIALTMLVAMLFGLAPHWRVVGDDNAALAAVSVCTYQNSAVRHNSIVAIQRDGVSPWSLATFV